MTKRQQQWNYIFFLILWLGYSAVTLLLFHRQSVFYGGNYPSDMYYYIADIQGSNTAYEYPYRLMFWTARLLRLLFEPRMAMAVTVTGFNSLSVLILKYYADKMFAKTCPAVKNRGILSTLLVFSLFFVSMLYPNIGADAMAEVTRYSGVYSPNPYHNATYLAVRPFSILCFVLFCDILQNYEEKVRYKEYVCFSAALFLATFAKPSFTFVFVATAGLILVWRLIKAKGRNWKQTFCLGLAFFPTFLDLLYQFWGVFGGKHGEATGIGISFLRAWKENASNVPLSLLLGLLFPLVVLMGNWKQIKTVGWYRFSWQLLAVSLATVMFLYEKGYRMGHMNFAWGYMHGMFFVYAASVVLLVQHTVHKSQKLPLLLIQWSVYAMHLICGLDYFRVLMAGGTFA